MTAKEYLEQYKKLDARIDAKTAQVDRLRGRLRYASGSSGGVRSTQPADKIGELTARIVDLEREINSEIDELIEFRREIKSRIAALPDPIHRDILEMRYISCWTVVKVAVKRGCSVETVYKLQRKALKSFTDCYSMTVV